MGADYDVGLRSGRTGWIGLLRVRGVGDGRRRGREVEDKQLLRSVWACGLRRV